MKSAGSDLYLDARKANGISQGINSPLVNPWVDLTKNGNNATFQNIAGTTSDGWVNVLLPNGKTMPFLKLDGVDTVGIIPNNPSVDIVGLDEFEIDVVILTPSVLQDGWVVAKNLSGSGADLQYGLLLYATGQINTRISGNDYIIGNAGTILTNSIYNINIIRQNGRLVVKINLIEKYNQLNSISIVSQPYLRIGARSTNAGGTAHGSFSNIYIAALSIAKNPDFTKLSSAWAKVVKYYI